MSNNYTEQVLKNHFFRFKLFADRPNEMLDEDDYEVLIFITQQDMSSHMTYNGGNIYNYLYTDLSCDPSGENVAEKLDASGWHEISGHTTKDLEASGLEISAESFKDGTVPNDISFNNPTYIIIQSIKKVDESVASDLYTHLSLIHI